MKYIYLTFIFAIFGILLPLPSSHGLTCFSCEKEIRDGALVENDQTKSCTTFRRASEVERKLNFIEKCYPAHNGCHQTTVKSQDGKNLKQVFGCHDPAEDLDLRIISDTCVPYEEEELAGTFCKCDVDLCLVENEGEDNSEDELEAVESGAQEKSFGILILFSSVIKIILD